MSEIASWVIATFAFMILIFFVFAMLLYLRRCINNVAKKYGDAADLSSAVALLEADKEKLEQSIAQQKDELLKMEGERQRQATLRQELLALEADRTARRQELEQAIEALTAIQVQIRELDANKIAKNKELADIQQKIKDAQAQQQQLPNLRAQVDQLKKDLERKTEIEAALRVDNDRITQNDQKINKQQDVLDDLQKSIDPLQKKHNDLENKIKAEEQKLSLQRDQLFAVKTEFTALNAQLPGLKAEVEKLKKEREIIPGKDVGGTPQNDKALEELMRKPAALVSRSFVQKANEQQLLQDFTRILHTANLHFPERTINAFHTSLKCQDINPLTVLAGVSGTGKTLLPVKYAEFMGINQVILSVSPRWDSAQDLFGFYNYLERRYKATELSRCLLRMDPYSSTFTSPNDKTIREGLLMVLLDEMNLARPEYYFSEFLSKLELRRTVDPQDNESRGRASIELDTGTGHEFFSLWVPENILFVGTMNEDESTQTLSDKVLDRANVLRFGKPAEHTGKKPNVGSIKGQNALSHEAWKKWKKSDIQGYATACEGWTKELNKALAGIGRAFGFRVEEAIYSYVANYPGAAPNSAVMRQAFADQVEQKILPKLRGCDMTMSASGDSLDIIEKVINELDDRELLDAFRLARDNALETGIFLWQGVTRS